MPSKTSKWELGFVHYIAKFTILRFVISRFECSTPDSKKVLSLSAFFLKRYSFTTGGQIFRFKSQYFSPFRFMYITEILKEYAFNKSGV